MRKVTVAATYGSPFIANNHGCILKETDRSAEGVILQTFYFYFSAHRILL